MYPNRGFVSIQAIILILVAVITLSTVLLAFANAQVAARDEKRLKDIRQFRVALKLFYDENGYYPQSLGSGMPRGMNVYLDFWPTAPKAENGCTGTQNEYIYAQKFSGQDYILSFCLGEDSKDLVFGPHTARSSGID